VTVPAGVTVGTMFQVNTPTGPMQVIAPVGAGQQMIVNVPAAPAPVVTATAVPAMGAPVVAAVPVSDAPLVIATPVTPMQVAPTPPPQTQQMTRTVAETAAGGSQPLWSAQELNGCWINCYPNDYACSIARMTNEGDDVRIGTGVCCVLLIPVLAARGGCARRAPTTSTSRTMSTSSPPRRVSRMGRRARGRSADGLGTRFT